MNTGCPYCTGQKVNHTNSLLVINPRLASEWHITKNGNLTPNDVTKGSNKKVWWQCDQGHEWKANISSRETKGCPFCSGRLPTKENNLLVYDPDVVKWWDYEINEKNPEDYTPNSGKYVWWKCVKGHSWKLQIYNMENSKGDRCPYCNGLYPSEENNLLIKYPELCKEWDYTKNKKRPEEFLPNANQKAWWICEECGNEWKAMIEQRTIGTGCPACGESKGEKRIRKYFIKNEIVFEPQKEFEGLLGIRGGNLSYDFFLPKQNLLIEYQGEFHDGNGNYYMKKNLERQQEHDKRKKEFAKQNNIKLLEIWYWDYENIESILENNLI
jgi:hypothetical protein